jgi:NAD(P)-dependent dehydrogenase (short-subunit alcohol dehydrogenase family)
VRRFEDKVALITGGAAGLGEGVALRLAEEGAKIVIADVDAEAGEKVAAGLPDAIFVQVDTSDPAQVEAAFAAGIAKYGKVDVVHNNAGITGEQQSVHETTVENWNHVMSINASGVFYVLKWGIESFLKAGGGSMVITSSSAALAAQENITPYTFAKAGIMGVTRSAAVEYATRGIRVNAIAPTAVLTPMVEAFIEASEDPAAFRAERETWNPVPGWPYASDIAGVVAFLASDEAKWITGLTIPIDGGYTAR